MRDVLRCLRRAQRQRAGAGHIAPRVHHPAELQRGHPFVAQLQPEVQLFEEPQRAKHQRRGRLDLGVQLDPGIKHGGQREPGVNFCLQTVGAIQRVQQLCAKTPHHTTPRQRPHVTPAGAADAGECGQMRAGGGEGSQRQRVRSLHRLSGVELDF